MASRSYLEALDWLYEAQNLGMKLGLDAVRKLLNHLGSEVEWSPLVCHVAGTNGKGSVCAMLETMLRAQGVKTGLYISPHLSDYRERMQVNGKLVLEEELVGGVERLQEVVPDLEQHPSFFELSLALALMVFKQHRVQATVLETGLGGRLDATNVCTPSVCVITPIGMDHEKWLGDSLAKIAAEKAGIIKEAVPVVTGFQEAEVLEVLQQHCADKNAPLHVVKDKCEVTIGLRGEHQRANAALALKAMEVLCETQASVLHPQILTFTPHRMHQGLEQAQWPGRFECLEVQGQRWVLDGAHNVMAAQALHAEWKEAFGEEKAVVVLGMLRDKNIEAVLRILSPLAKRWCLLPVKSSRGEEPEQLAACLQEMGVAADTIEVIHEPNTMLPAMLDRLQGEQAPILLTGSLYLIGALRPKLLSGQGTCGVEAVDSGRPREQ